MTDRAAGPADGATEDEESLISPELAAAVGKEMGSTRAWVEAELVRRMGMALEVEDPALEAALDSNDRSYDLPAWTIYAITRPQRMQMPGIDPWDTLMAAEELQIMIPLHLDDRLHVEQRIADVQERIGGRVGHSLFINLEWRYRRLPPRDGRDDLSASPNADSGAETIDNDAIGEEVARIRHTLTHFRNRHSGE